MSLPRYVYKIEGNRHKESMIYKTRKKVSRETRQNLEERNSEYVGRRSCVWLSSFHPKHLSLLKLPHSGETTTYDTI
jgi:hypothetical protein